MTANHVLSKAQKADFESAEQLDLFAAPRTDSRSRERERQLQEAVVLLQNKYGKNSVLKGMNFEDGATAIDRNGQIGGHKA